MIECDNGHTMGLCGECNRCSTCDAEHLESELGLMRKLDGRDVAIALDRAVKRLRFPLGDEPLEAAPRLMADEIIRLRAEAKERMRGAPSIPTLAPCTCGGELAVPVASGDVGEATCRACHMWWLVWLDGSGRRARERREGEVSAEQSQGEPGKSTTDVPSEAVQGLAPPSEQ